MIKKTRDWLAENWVTISYSLLVAVFFSFLYLFRLGSIVRGDSPYETILYLHINGIKDILANISFAPIKLLELIMVKIDEPNSTLLRSASALVVVISIVIFFRLIAKWHTYRIAIFATFLFAVSTYSLQLGRFTNQDAMYYLVIPSLILIGTWLKSKRLVNRFSIAMPAISILLYVPGFIYFVGILGIVFRKRIALAWKFVKTKQRIFAITTSTVILLPLLYGIILYPTQITKYLAIDRLINEGIVDVLKVFADIPSMLFLHGPTDSFRWLAGTPIFDIASTALFILGIYAYAKGPHTLRSRLLLLLGIMCMVIISTGTLVSVALIVPLVYIVIANGLVYLFQSWFTVFPRNPAARNTAIVLVSLLVALIAVYHLQRYFIAWPNSPQTKKALSVPYEEVVQ